MTQEEILSGNMLIAEFMGGEYISDGVWKLEVRSPLFESAFYVQYRLMYHTSWDWLKPVIDEIQTYRLAYTDLTEGVRNLSTFVDILPAWRAVVKFIQQYNQNKQT